MTQLRTDLTEFAELHRRAATEMADTYALELTGNRAFDDLLREDVLAGLDEGVLEVSAGCGLTDPAAVERMRVVAEVAFAERLAAIGQAGSA